MKFKIINGLTQGVPRDGEAGYLRTSNGVIPADVLRTVENGKVDIKGIGLVGKRSVYSLRNQIGLYGDYEALKSMAYSATKPAYYFGLFGDDTPVVTSETSYQYYDNGNQRARVHLMDGTGDVYTVHRDRIMFQIVRVTPEQAKQFINKLGCWDVDYDRPSGKITIK